MNCWKRLVLPTTLVPALLAVVVPTAASQSSGINPALLTKANAGDPAAQIGVGESYAAGNGIPRDLKLAADWYRRAAEKGDIAGELHLAALYRDGGKDFPRDMEQAANWYRKAADQGDVNAQATLGLLYFLGQGLQQDYVEAYFWLDLAAAVKGPKQQQYAANRQLIGTHITTDQLEEVHDRVAKWQAAHPRPAATE
ncbi:MAG: tetratricopeptide repeat protein [Terracidiphilus sp.]|jgi:TPR repeat protein